MFNKKKAVFITFVFVGFWGLIMVCVRSMPISVKKMQSSSVTSKKMAASETKKTTSARKTPSPVSLFRGATISAVVKALPAVVQPALFPPVVAKTSFEPNAPTEPQSPIFPTPPSGFRNFWNNMSNLTTANTNISMNTGNYFGSGATIVGANFGNVNISVAPSVISSGPSVYY